MKSKKGSTPIVYKDSLFRGIACLLASHFIVMMGNPDIKTFQAFLDWTYYPTLLINYVIALIAALAIKRISIALDNRHSWYSDIWRRALLQFTFGVLGVSILTFFLVFLYFVSFGQDLVASGYLDYELPFSIALFAILNLYYAAYYFYSNPRMPITISDNGEELFPDVESDLTAGNLATAESTMAQLGINDNSTGAEVDRLRIVKATGTSHRVEPREMLLVKSAKLSIPVRKDDVAMIFIYQRTVFLRMKGVDTLNECYMYDIKLEDLILILDPSKFFRINRQCILSIDVVGSYQNYSDRNLLVTLRQEYSRIDTLTAKEWTKIRTVSVHRVQDFKNWIDR
ncbi:MAG: hypothetical protein BGO31_12880 [Bacteroidetes bacterium 43-16]|nr:MAG: hypothetical protein BGO31_12880 [Bacteroidetes bacterium 43-16]